MPAKIQPHRPPGDGNVERLRARLAFLQAIEGLEKGRIIRELEDGVSPLYAKFSERYGGTIDLHTLSSLAPLLAEAKALSEALDGWRAAYHLDRDDWLGDAALKHLAYYDPNAAERLPFATVVSGAYWAPLAPEPFPEYRIDQESRAEFMERVRQYAAAAESPNAARGWTPGKVRHSLRKHAEWLARFQVLGESSTGAGKGAVEESSVRRAIVPLAKFLPVTLRVVPRGRPKKRQRLKK